MITFKTQDNTVFNFSFIPSSYWRLNVECISQEFAVKLFKYLYNLLEPEDLVSPKSGSNGKNFSLRSSTSAGIEAYCDSFIQVLSYLSQFPEFTQQFSKYYENK